MATDRQLQLMLGQVSPGRSRLFLAPAHDPPQRRAPLEQTSVVRTLRISRYLLKAASFQLLALPQRSSGQRGSTVLWKVELVTVANAAYHAAIAVAIPKYPPRWKIVVFGADLPTPSSQ